MARGIRPHRRSPRPEPLTRRWCLSSLASRTRSSLLSRRSLCSRAAVAATTLLLLVPTLCSAYSSWQRNQFTILGPWVGTTSDPNRYLLVNQAWFNLTDNSDRPYAPYAREMENWL